MPRIMLTGYIYRNTDGMYVSHCNELDTDTWAQSLDEAKRLTPDMIDTYFLMAAKIGMLQEVLAKLSAPNEASASATNVHGKWLATPVSDNGMHFAAKFEAVQAAA